MKQVAWFTLIVLGTLTGTWLVWEFRTTVILFLLAMIVAAAIRPIIDDLIERGWSRGMAIFIAYGSCISIIASLGIIFAGPFFTSIQELSRDLITTYEQIQNFDPDDTLLQRLVAQTIATSTALLQTLSETQINELLQFFLGAITTSFDLMGQLVIVLVLSIYWSTDQERFKRLWLSLLPVDLRTQAREIWHDVETDLGAYLRSELIQSLIAIVLLGAGYQFLGLKYPILLGVMGAIVWLVPWVGVLLAVIPAFIVGLLISPQVSLVATAWTILILCIMEFIIEPRIFNRQRYNSSLIIIMMVVMANIYGIIGLLFAAPLAAAIQIIVTRLLQQPSPIAEVLPQHSSIQTYDLQTRLQSVQKTIAQQDESPRPEILTLVERLTKLIERANEEI